MPKSTFSDLTHLFLFQIFTTDIDALVMQNAKSKPTFWALTKNVVTLLFGQHDDDGDGDVRGVEGALLKATDRSERCRLEMRN